MLNKKKIFLVVTIVILSFAGCISQKAEIAFLKEKGDLG